MIPYTYEVFNILFNAHVQTVHIPFHKAKTNLLNGDFYYEGITTDLKEFINECPKCQAINKLNKVNIPLKPIIDKGPRYEYQMDIWYIPKDICEITNYKYVLDVIDHFSKWMWAFPIKNKTKEEILFCFKTFTIAFGNPNGIPKSFIR